MQFASTLPRLVAEFALGVAMCFSCLDCAGTGTEAPGQLSADEYSIKAAFLYNLAKFVDWPPGKFGAHDSPLIIGVVGEAGFERTRAVVKDKLIERHKVVVRLVASNEEVKDCHILFVTRSTKQNISEMVIAAHNAAVLTVGETDQFLDSGGMIRFYAESENLRLEINDDAVHRAGLSIKANALSALINKGIAKLKKV